MIRKALGPLEAQTFLQAQPREAEVEARVSRSPRHDTFRGAKVACLAPGAGRRRRNPQAEPVRPRNPWSAWGHPARWPSVCLALCRGRPGPARPQTGLGVGGSGEDALKELLGFEARGAPSPLPSVADPRRRSWRGLE